MIPATGKASKCANFAKAMGTPSPKAMKAAQRHAVTAKAKGFFNATAAKAKIPRFFSFTRRSTNENCHYYFKLKNRRLTHHEQTPIHNRRATIIALQAAPQDAVVIIQGDSEGNSFSPIAGVDHDALSYEPDTPVRGDVVPGDGGVKCVVLYPKA